MSSGIIIQRNAVLLTAVKDPSMYGSLDARNKAYVDDISAKAPDKRDEHDMLCLINSLIQASALSHLVDYGISLRLRQ